MVAVEGIEGNVLEKPNKIKILCHIEIIKTF